MVDEKPQMKFSGGLYLCSILRLKRYVHRNKIHELDNTRMCFIIFRLLIIEFVKELESNPHC